MRYPKGTLNLSEEHDYPLLQQLARSEFATHDQLFEFMRFRNCRLWRESFNWRVGRLLQHGFVQRQTVAKRAVYTLTVDAVLLLEGFEKRFTLISPPRRNGEPENRHMLHSLELNDIHLSAARSGALVDWTSAVEIRSQNELTHCGYAKDYDAIVKLRVNSQAVTFALEYERSAKGDSRYVTIMAAIRDERHVEQFLYLTGNEHLLRHISWLFRHLDRRVHFGLVADWNRGVLEMPAFNWRAKRYVPLNSLLAEPGLVCRASAELAGAPPSIQPR